MTYRTIHTAAGLSRMAEADGGGTPGTWKTFGSISA
jgi:hypothetical protein